MVLVVENQLFIIIIISDAMMEELDEWIGQAVVLIYFSILV
jgi:hypothetical protein